MVEGSGLEECGWSLWVEKDHCYVEVAEALKLDVSVTGLEPEGKCLAYPNSFFGRF